MGNVCPSFVHRACITTCSNQSTATVVTHSTMLPTKLPSRPGLSATSVHVFVRMSVDVATVDTRMITGACVRDGNHDEGCTKNDSDVGDVEDTCVK